ncbi:MAG: non-ribosomal peptide synthetase, partial [Natronosporangium sp.]
AGEVSYLALAFHHIVVDGWSVGVILSELDTLYQGRTLPRPAAGFPTVAASHRQDLSRRRPELSAYWRRSLDGAPPESTFPGPGHRTTHRGERITIGLPAGTHQAVAETAGRLGVTPYLLYLTVLMIQLARGCGRGDVVVGIATTNRTTGEELAVIGPFATQVPVRVRLPASTSLRAAVELVRDAVLGAVEHQGLPFHHVIRAAGATLEQGLNPVFQVMAVQRDWREPRYRFAGRPAECWDEYTGVSRSHVAMYFPGDGPETRIGIEFDLGRFDRRYARDRIAAGYRSLLATMLADPAAPCAIAAGDPAPAPAGEVVHERFLAVAAANPDAIAITQGTTWCDYSELERRSARVAAGLRARGVARGDVVAVCLPPGTELVTAQLAVLRSGAAFLPTDPDWPADRMGAILTDARAALLVGAWPGEADGAAPPVPVRGLAELAATAPAGGLSRVPVEGSDLAYLIYTSGSTGSPKGVMIEHRSLCWLTDRRHPFAVHPTDRVAQVCNVAFDASTQEIWCALLNGATLVVPQTRRLAPGDYAELYQGCSVALLVSGLFQQLVQHPRCAEAIRLLRLVLVGGDRLDPAVLPLPAGAGAGPGRDGHGRLHVYGLTEATSLATAGSLPDRHGAATVPVGPALPGTRVRVLDERLRDVPAGAEGKIYLMGPHLARGYHDQPAHTALRFVAAPGGTGERMLATGDRGRLLENGWLVLHGREDQQVKVRGFRLELGEIEGALREHPSVRVARVAVDPAGGWQRLVGFVQSLPGTGPDALRAELVARLRRRLPEFMQPHDLVVVDQFPVTPNGKVSVEELLAASAATPGTAPAGTAPVDRMRSLWSEVLGTDVTERDSFFALGGDSIQALRVLVACQEEFGVDLSLADLFQQPELRTFTEVVIERGKASHD